MFSLSGNNIWYVVGNVSVGGGISAPGPRTEGRKRRQPNAGMAKKSRQDMAGARAPSTDIKTEPGPAPDTEGPSELKGIDLQPNVSAESAVTQKSRQSQTDEVENFSTVVVNYALRLGKSLFEEKCSQLVKGVNLTKEEEKNVVSVAAKHYSSNQEEFQKTVDPAEEKKTLVQRFFSLVSDGLHTCFVTWCGFKSMRKELQDAVLEVAKEALNYACSIVMKGL